MNWQHDLEPFAVDNQYQWGGHNKDIPAVRPQQAEHSPG